MKLSRFFWQTYKEVPADAEIMSHKLLLRAGMIYKVGAGLYSYLPMGLRVIHKVEAIIRDELSKINASEISMNFVTPSELWKESGRWDEMGPEMQRFKDRKDNDFCLSPTNEETITDIFKKTTSSYKQLPVNLYQITTKYRDEIRPRFGLMRGKEFLMKDAYTFSLDKECLDRQYQAYYQAYSNVFKKMGLDFIIVEADAGAMASSDAKTHEFQVLADSGEDQVVFAKEINYAANLEKAKTYRLGLEFQNSSEIQEVETLDMKSCKEVADFLKIPTYQTLKTLVFTAFWPKGKSAHYMLMLLGDDEINEVKLKSFLKAERIEVANDDLLKEKKLIKGFMSPYQNEVMSVILDEAINVESSYVVGANKINFHIKGFTPRRDLSLFKQADVRLATEGDFAYDKKTPVQFKRGIEVGHIFQLGDKYTKSMNAQILDQNGKKIAPLMGCYGIGVTRTIAAAIEQSHDDNGIIWPVAIAPFQVYLASLAKSNEFKSICENVYQELTSSGFEVLFDDRNLSMGAMLKDADLLGLPVRVLMGERDFQKDAMVEVCIRKSGKKDKVSLDKLSEYLSSALECL